MERSELQSVKPPRRVRAVMRRVGALSLLFIPVALLAGPPTAVPDSGLASFRFLPVGDVFRPLLADPKERQFFMSFLGLRSDRADYTAWSVGFGESLGIARWVTGKFQTQVGVAAGVFSQFNWSSESRDLINTDFTFGVVGTERWGFVSARGQLYHQSSHLGDEFLMNNPVPRINLSYEALEGVLALETGRGRVYGGGERLLTADPPTLKKNALHAGLEYRGKESGKVFFRPVAGIDVKWGDQQNWRRSISVKAGPELGQPTARERHARLMFEYYHGTSPYGQFYNLNVQYWGLGVYLGF